MCEKNPGSSPESSHRGCVELVCGPGTRLRSLVDYRTLNPCRISGAINPKPSTLNEYAL